MRLIFIFHLWSRYIWNTRSCIISRLIYTCNCWLMMFRLVFLRVVILYQWKWSIFLSISWSTIWVCVCGCWAEVRLFWVLVESGMFVLFNEVILVVAIKITEFTYWSNSYALILHRNRFQKVKSVRLFILCSFFLFWGFDFIITEMNLLYTLFYMIVFLWFVYWSLLIQYKLFSKLITKNMKNWYLLILLVE